MNDIIKLGSGSACPGERLEPALELVKYADINYIIFDSLSESEMLKFEKHKLEKQSHGYDTFMEARLNKIWPLCYNRKIKIIGIMGAANTNTAQNIAEKKKDEQGLASIYNIKGAINVAIGKYKNARINYEKALEIQMNLNNKIKESKFRSNYANCLNQLQEVDLALEQSEKAIQIKEALEQHQSLGASYAFLSNTYYGSGKYTEAIEHAVKALGVFRMNEMTLFEGRILTLIADLYMLIGQYDNMSKYIKEADVILKDFNESFLLGKIERMKAIYALYNNNSDDAIENINNAIDLFEIAEMRPYIIEAHIDKLNILVERK